MPVHSEILTWLIRYRALPWMRWSKTSPPFMSVVLLFVVSRMESRGEGIAAESITLVVKVCLGVCFRSPAFFDILFYSPGSPPRLPKLVGAKHKRTAWDSTTYRLDADTHPNGNGRDSTRKAHLYIPSHTSSSRLLHNSIGLFEVCE